MKPPKETTNSESMAAWWRCQAIVYFFAAGHPPTAIKIGVTAVTKGSLQQAVQRRFREIQSSNHETIELLGVIRFSEGEFPAKLAETRERELHIKFASLQRFKQHTRGAEWFTPGAELLDYIREHTETPEVLSIPRVIGLQINRE
jgi:hypothetical protein